MAIRNVPPKVRLGLGPDPEAKPEHITDVIRRSLCCSNGRVAPRVSITQGFLLQRANGAGRCPKPKGKLWALMASGH